MAHGRKPTFSGKNLGKLCACHARLDRLALLEDVRDIDPEFRLGFNDWAAVHPNKFLDSKPWVRLADDGRIAAIGFPMKEKNICPWEGRRFLRKGKIDKSRGIWNYHGTGSGTVVVKDKIFGCLIALKDGRNGKSGFDADDPLALEAWKINVLLGVVAGCGSW